jgi:hypothetical protein
MQVIQGTNAGGRLGEVLGTGLNQLAQHKLAQLSKQYEAQSERNQFAQGLAPLLGQDTANFLSHLGPDERKYALQNISSLMQLNQQPGQQQPGIESLQQAGQQPQEQSQIQQQEQQLTPERAKLLEGVFTSPQEKREREKLELAKRQAGLKERESLIKETKTYVDTLKDKEKASKEGNLRLRRMETLIDKGNLPNAALWSALSKLEHAPFISGLTAPFAELLKGAVKWKSGNAADIEEFEKLSTEFVKNAKQYFGPRITQQEVQLFMQTIPTLMQTDAGKKKLIENIRSLNELTEIEAKAARSIIKANGGIPPRDIEQQVQDKIGDKIDKVANKFTVR